MKKLLFYVVCVSMTARILMAQVEPGAGKWKTWVIPTGDALRLAAPPDSKGHLKGIAMGKGLHYTARPQPS